MSLLGVLCGFLHFLLSGPRDEAVIVMIASDATAAFLERPKPGSRIALISIGSSPFESLCVFCV